MPFSSTLSLGKIAREVTETTHIKVEQSHHLGVSSFVLTSETVKDKNTEASTSREEVIRVTDEHGQELVIPVDIEPAVDDEELRRRLKEVGRCEDEAWTNYSKVTKQAIKGFI